MIRILENFNTLEHILLSIPGVIIAVVIHEFVKSLVAHKMGDTGIAAQGRLTLNPLKHMDALGSIFMAIWGFGWANPVKLAPGTYKERKKAMLLIFALPFIASIVVGGIFAVLAGIWWFHAVFINPYSTAFHNSVNWALILASQLNIGFAILNLIPIYPLDGTIFLSGVSPTAGAKVAQSERILQVILALGIIFGIVHFLLGPLVSQIFRLFFQLAFI
ncbi:MAG: site-2 protease family protein [Defluviitaleaceae bacterium]|nr:site-2 protease family protein [Defluviitaleaceae bacterium]